VSKVGLMPYGHTCLLLTRAGLRKKAPAWSVCESPVEIIGLQRSCETPQFPSRGGLFILGLVTQDSPTPCFFSCVAHPSRGVEREGNAGTC